MNLEVNQGGEFFIKQVKIFFYKYTYPLKILLWGGDRHVILPSNHYCNQGGDKRLKKPLSVDNVDWVLLRSSVLNAKM